MSAIGAASGDAYAWATVEGSVSGVLPAGLYRVTGDLLVPAGRTLVLAPGTTLEFEDDAWEEFELDCQGALLAEGTPALPVIFRPAPRVAEFNYLRLADGTSRLRHCRVERAGRVEGTDEGGLWIDGCSPLIEDCEVVDARWCGVVVTGGGSVPFLARTSVTGAAADGFAADGGAGLRLENCRAIGNGGDGIVFSSGSNAIAGCLVAGNGEDGVDCRGLVSFEACLVNCTVADNGAEELSDSGAFTLVNCAVTACPAAWREATHTYASAAAGFHRFNDPGHGDYRLGADSPCRDAGSRFGIAAALLPPTDLDGNPRRNGIVDIGAYESTLPPETGEAGLFVSPALLRPRLAMPEIRVPGTAFDAIVAAPGTYARSEVSVQLLVEGAEPLPLPIGSVTPRDVEPGSDLAVQLYPVGIERVQVIAAGIPAGAPAGLHGIRVRLGDRVYESPSAVRVHASWPESWGFIHVTDLHVGSDAESVTAAERLRRFVREANFLQPELVVITGDLCENANLENAAFADTLLTILRRLTVPAYALPGNHERYNEEGAYNPLGYFRHFHAINRFANAEVTVGRARFWGLDTGPELGLAELYRCSGPSAEALDWVEGRQAALDPEADQPRFLLSHGPTHDYFAWNVRNLDRVQDLVAGGGLSLCLAGHTHRVETYRNPGPNWIGRNDYQAADDWGEEVPFPGYPLHVETSSLGKEEHLPLPRPAADSSGTVPAAIPDPPGPHRRGLLGDDIAFRWVQVDGRDVTSFTADTDGDGHRGTEAAWLLGELEFETSTGADGSIVSRVTNHHHETWRRPHHFIPAVPGLGYYIEGGSIVHRFADGTMEVEVDSVGPAAVSVVRLVPHHPASAFAATRSPERLRVTGSPFVTSVTIGLEAAAGRADAEISPEAAGGNVEFPTLSICDPAGRRVRRLQPGADGTGAATWDGRDEEGHVVAGGVYFVRADDRPDLPPARVVKLR